MSPPAASPGSSRSPDRSDRPPDQALVLLGHGSHLSAASSRPVYEHAARIRDRGLFREVREGFWKEEPALRWVLDTVESRRVYAVPVFVSEGYFTRVVLPRELGISGPVTRRRGQTVHYCPPVGTHPLVAELVLERARACTGEAAAPDDAVLLLVGHGTDRHARSSDVVHRTGDRIRREGPYRQVVCAFLDEDPRVEEAVAELRAPHVVIVPFLVSEGWHTRETLPRSLGLSGKRTEREDRVLWYTDPVGTAPRVADVVMERAREAGARLPDSLPERRV